MLVTLLNLLTLFLVSKLKLIVYELDRWLLKLGLCLFSSSFDIIAFKFLIHVLLGYVSLPLLNFLYDVISVSLHTVFYAENAKGYCQYHWYSKIDGYLNIMIILVWLFLIFAFIWATIHHSFIRITHVCLIRWNVRRVLYKFLFPCDT